MEIKRNKIYQFKARVIKNENIKRNYFHCIFKAPLVAKTANPGQFLNISLNDGLEPLLRRPFSIHKVKSGCIEILYEVVGPGSRILSKKKPNDSLDVLGSLGNGFFLREQQAASSKQILVAGGMGVAPLAFLAEKIKGENPIVLIGAKTKNHLICADDFRRLGCKVHISTDDGSAGFRGRVTDLLGRLLRTMNYPLCTIYACGPKFMLKELSAISDKFNIPVQVSLEEHMSCGFGACLGCVVKVKGQRSKVKGKGKKDGFEYKRVCREGPVFFADQIIWEEN